MDPMRLPTRKRSVRLSDDVYNAIRLRAARAGIEFGTLARIVLEDFATGDAKAEVYR